MPTPSRDPSPPPGKRPSVPQPDPDTDPGRPHPYESLYRSRPGEVGEPSRPTPRHFEQHVSRPDDAQDGFGWLYRAEPGPPAPPDTGAAAPGEPPQPRQRARRPLVVVLVVLLVGVLVTLGVVLLRQRDATDPLTPTPTAARMLSGVLPNRPTVSCQAPGATDDAGRPVAYGPENLIDGDPETAWRCDGTGLGQTVTFTFPAPVTISQVSLVNGYAKSDPASGADRYPEYRRVTRVGWTVGGTELVQDLADDDRMTQAMDIPAQQVTEVTLRIVQTSAPGSTLTTRDATLVSEVAFAG